MNAQENYIIMSVRMIDCYDSRTEPKGFSSTLSETLPCDDFRNVQRKATSKENHSKWLA